jgi:hypothetical protein
MRLIPRDPSASEDRELMEMVRGPVAPRSGIGDDQDLGRNYARALVESAAALPLPGGETGAAEAEKRARLVEMVHVQRAVLPVACARSAFHGFLLGSASSLALLGLRSWWSNRR